MDFQPPKWADRFLRWYCHPDLLEEIQGDAHELFYRTSEEIGIKKANRNYIWNIFLFFRWSNLNKSNKLKINSFIMFSSYVKIGFRNISRNWMISSINIMGLALGVGCAMTVFIFVDSQYNMDSFHSKKTGSVFYLIMYPVKKNTERWAVNPFLLGPDLLANNSAVENVARVEYHFGNVRFENNVFHEPIAYVDPSFLKIFDFEMEKGNNNVLDEKQHMVISQLMAEKYFGDTNPMGQSISINYPGDRSQTFVIGGVFNDFPINASFTFDLVVPMSNHFDLSEEKQDWDELTRATFVLFEEGHHSSELDNEMEKYVALHNNASPDWTIDKFEFLPLDQMALQSYDFRSSLAMGSHPAGNYTLAISALILLILACFNYMNIAVASATKRLKEIALRKVMGGHRRNIIHQFLTENIILCFFAMVFGTLLSYFLFIPGIDSMIPLEIPFAFSSPKIAILCFGGLLLLIGFASGSYPAFYISRFQPVSIFKGNQKLGKNNLFSKILLSFQLILAFMTVVSCFIFYENGRHMSDKDWGYNPQGLFTVVVQDAHQYEALKEMAENEPSVISYAASNSHINSYDPITTVESLLTTIKTNHYSCSSNYLETMNLRLEEGRFFDNKKNSIDSRTAIINNEFANKMGWSKILDQTFIHDSITYTVIGSIENFYTYGFAGEMEAAFFSLADPKDYLYFTFKVPEDKIFIIDDFVHEAWYDIAPNDPYNRKFQQFSFDQFYQQNTSNMALIGFISFSLLFWAALDSLAYYLLIFKEE